MPGNGELLQIEMQGIGGVLAMLGALSGRELVQTAEMSTKKSAERAGVPIVKRAAPVRRAIGPSVTASRNRGKRGQKGPLSRNVTVRRIRKRSGEVVALSIAPRAWYAHFVIGGTVGHVIKASDAQGVRATTGQVKTINRLAAGYYAGSQAEAQALLVGGRFYARVHHPGARANPFLNGLGHPIGEAMSRALSEDLIRSAIAAVRRGNARSAQRAAARAATRAAA